MDTETMLQEFKRLVIREVLDFATAHALDVETNREAGEARVKIPRSRFVDGYDTIVVRIEGVP